MSQSTFKKTPLLLAMMIIATGQVGVSIYLPSLPLIASDLSVTQVDVQLLVTLFLVGFGLSQLFYGPMSDAVGRRPIFLLGQGVYL
ncbi:MFS transporter, partial [Vibrio sp. OPT20]